LTREQRHDGGQLAGTQALHAANADLPLSSLRLALEDDARA
jgi:hypothetical protein